MEGIHMGHLIKNIYEDLLRNSELILLEKKQYV